MPLVAPSAPVAPVIVPPLLLPPTVVLVPSPLIVKLPLVFFRKIPLGGAVLADTLVSDMANGVVPLVREISTAVAPLVLIAPLVEVMVFVLSVASRPR